MKNRAKLRQRLEAQLHELWTRHGGDGRGVCWICNSTRGMKTSRMSYGVRCKRCRDSGKSTEDVETYERLKQQLRELEEM